jgi:hypothetical protein
MHYGVLVIVEAQLGATRGEIEELVTDVLEPHKEQHWDWYQIGGRWTGHFDGYQPDADPANIETCDLCGGTGDRATFRSEPKENQHPLGCNGCLGKGTKARWPTQWAAHDGDVKPVSQLIKADVDVFAICVGYDWHGGEEYQPWKADGEKFHKRELPPLAWLQEQYPNHVAVIVDCHN